MAFVIYSCGCIGLPPEGPTHRAVIFQFCDSDGEPFGCCRRPMSDGTPARAKEYSPLTEVGEATIVKELAALIADGYGLRMVKGILK